MPTKETVITTVISSANGEKTILEEVHKAPPATSAEMRKTQKISVETSEKKPNHNKGPASITPKKPAKAEKDSNGAKSSSSLSPKTSKKAKSPSRPTNQPNIGSFFMKMKSNKDGKKVTSSTLKSKGPSITTVTTKNNHSSISTDVEANSKSDSMNKQQSQSLDTAGNETKQLSPTKPKSTIAKKSEKKIIKNANDDDDIMAIILGTHDDAITKNTNNSKSTPPKLSKKKVHLPHLITQDLQSKPDNIVENNSELKNKEVKAKTQASKKSKARKDPLKPKNSRSSYVFYSQAVRQTVVKENPDMKFGDITKLIAKQFKELSSEQKKEYDDLANADKIRFQQEIELYKNSQVESNDKSHDQVNEHDTKESSHELEGEIGTEREIPPDSIANDSHSKSENIDPDDDVTVEMEQMDEDITIYSNNDDSVDDNENDCGETKEDRDFIAMEEEEEDDEGDNCDIAPSEKDEEESASIGAKQAESPIVNVLQPRKKVDSQSVHTLKARKKQKSKDIKINELQPRKKIKVNELTPRKKATLDSQVVTISDPRKKTKSELQKVTISDETSPIKPKQLSETKLIGISSTPSSAKEKGVIVNQLKPRKKVANPKPKSDENFSQSKSITEQSQKDNKSVDSNGKSSDSVNIISLSEAEKQSLAKYQSLRSQYLERVKELIENAMNGSVEEEDFQSENIKDKHYDVEECASDVDKAIVTDFRDEWVDKIAHVVQGSPLSLNELSSIAAKIISDTLEPNTIVSLETVAAKIKLIAARTQYLSPIPSSNDDSTILSKIIDIFNDTTESNMWRWELISLELLPDEKKSSAKKARNGRKKLKYHQNAILKLVQSIDDFVNLLNSPTRTDETIQRRIVKISADEEKVLKYEREAEKLRLQQEAKLQKEKDKLRKEQEKAQKEKEKAQKQAQKLMEKEAEKDRKKEEAAKKQEEKTRLEAEKGRQKEEASKKQKARMLSFFKTSTSKVKDDTSAPPRSMNSPISLNSSFDSKLFWNKINCDDELAGALFSNLSGQAKKSRRRKTEKVNIRVFASVVPENPFDQQPYDEERIISIWNKYKYLSFHEDYRPPYHGTWTKPPSSIITGKKPFGKDTAFLDYEIDSEAEWEEGDNEQGDDCSADDVDEDDFDEDEDTTKYNYQDGWLADDGDLALEDDDEETMALRKKKAALNSGDTTFSQKVLPACVIAPLWGGLPLITNDMECPSLASEHVEGLEVSDAKELLSSHDGEIIVPRGTICLDPFPPSASGEKKQVVTKSQQDSAAKKQSQEMSNEDMKTFAQFIHCCTLKSKDLIVEELLLKHKSIIPSRAQANRKIDLIATKRRIKNGGGVIWEVKDDVLKSLGLEELIKPPEPVIEENNKEESEKKVKKKSTKKVKKAKMISESTKTKKGGKSKVIKAMDVEVPGSPALISPADKTPKKRKQSEVSKASSNLLTSFLKKKKVSGA